MLNHTPVVRTPPTHSKPERLRAHGESVPVRESHGCGDGLPVDTHGVHQGHAAQDDLAPLHVQQGVLAGHRSGVDTDVRARVPDVRGNIGASGAALSARTLATWVLSPFNPNFARQSIWPFAARRVLKHIAPTTILHILHALAGYYGASVCAGDWGTLVAVGSSQPHATSRGRRYNASEGMAPS
jgi:hypothetical protein